MRGRRKVTPQEGGTTVGGGIPVLSVRNNAQDELPVTPKYIKVHDQ